MIEVINQFTVQMALNSLARNIEGMEWDDKFCLIGILKGGVYTLHELLKRFTNKRNITVGYLGLSSYGKEMVSACKIKVTYPLDLELKCLVNRNVWIIDDVYDSGLTMGFAVQMVEATLEHYGGIDRIKTAVLVRKENVQQQGRTIVPNLIGIDYPCSDFLVGAGMGKGEKYRCFDSIYKLEPDEMEQELSNDRDKSS